MPYSFKTPIVINTNQTTTLGSVDITTLNTSGLITANGGVSIPSNGNNNGNSLYVVNSSSDSSSYSDIALGNNTANALHIFLNSSTRTGDGGINTATVRNDAGALRLQSSSGAGMSIATDGSTTFSGSLISTFSTTTLGTSTIGAITGTSATFSTTLGVTGLATFGTGGLTSTAGTTTLGSSTIGAITGTSATFSSIVTASNGLTSTAGTTTLGVTTIGALTVTGNSTLGSIQSTNFNSITTQGAYLQWNRSGAEGETWLINTTVGSNPGIRFGKSNLSNTVTELMRIQDNGNVGIGTTSTSNKLNVAGGISQIQNVDGAPSQLLVQNTNSGTGAYSIATIASNSASLNLLVNSSSRTDDGGVNTATIRNDAGTLKLQSIGGGGISITSGLATFDSGLTSTIGTTTLGTTTIGAITGTSATFSTTLGVTGLATFGSGGLTSTAGTTTLGAITGTSATFSSTLTADGGVSIINNVNGGGNNFYQYNANTGTNAFSNFIIGNNTGNLNIFLNGSGRTGDGGANTATIRNGVGILRLQTSGSTGISISTNGLATFDSGLTSTAGTTTLGVTTIGAITGTSATFSTTLGVTGNASVGSLTVNSSNLVARTISTNANWPFIFSATAGLGGSFLFCSDNASTNYIEINSSKTLRVYGNIGVDSTTASTSNTTGAITSSGGLGISNTTDATSTTNGGSITTAGGLAVAKKAYIGNNTDTASINIRSTGGTYQAGSIYSDSGWGMLLRSAVDNPSLATFRFAKFDDTALMFMYDSGQMSLPFTTASTSSTTGVFTSSGGLGISNTTDATSSTNGGTITTAGGLAVAKKAFIGTDLTVTGNSTLGSIQSTNFNSITTQGAYLQWNRTVTEGETWLINTTVGINPGIRFGKSNLSNTVTELMRIQDNGNVGIGTTSTSNKLNVAGGISQIQDVNGVPSQLLVQNTNSGTSAFSLASIASNSGSLNLFVNSSTRTADGGASGATIRNEYGQLTLGSASHNTNFPGNITRNAQLVTMTITGLQAIPTTIDWNGGGGGSLANMSLVHSSGTFTYSGTNPSTFYLNIGIYLTGATAGIFVGQVYLNGSILSRHGQYCINGGTVLVSTVINMSNTNTFRIYIDGASGNANDSGMTFTWLRISQI